MNDDRDPARMAPPTNEEKRELFIARHFVALFVGLVLGASAAVALFVRGCG